MNATLQIGGHRLSNATLRWGGLIVMLVAELEFLIVPHYTIRTALKELLGGLPLYHMLLAFLTFCVLLRYTVADKLPPLESTPSSFWYLVVHWACYTVVWFNLQTLWNRLSGTPVLAAVVWISLMTVFVGAWMAFVVPPRLWGHTFRLHGPWLLGCFLAGIVSIVLSKVSEGLWTRLAVGTFYSSSVLLHLIFQDVVVDPNSLTIGTTDFHIQILPGCSGFEGMGLIAMFTVAYLWLRRKDLYLNRAIWLLPIGMAVIWVANTLRITALVMIGTWVDPAIAIRGFHSQAGWIAFSVIGVCLVMVAEKRQWFHRQQQAEEESMEYPAVALVLPLLTLLFAHMLSQASSVGFDIFYPLRTLVVVWMLACCWPGWKGLFTGVSWRESTLIGLVVYAVWIALVHGTNDPEADPTKALESQWCLAWIVIRIIGAVVVIPIVEELAFRGYLLRRLQDREFDRVPIGAITPVAMVLSSVAFGLLHSDRVAGTLAGLAYAYTVHRRGRFADAVVAHGVTNLCLAIQVLVLHQWSLWT